MKEFHTWVADMENSIEDESVVIKERDIEKKEHVPCTCKNCLEWYAKLRNHYYGEYE